jgi:hypothetical protein
MTTTEAPAATTTNPTPDFRSLSPYGCARVVNVELEELGLSTLPPQMFYTYVKKGYIDSFLAADGKRKVSEIALAAWFTAYVAKKQALAAAKATIAADPKTEATTEVPAAENDESVEVDTNE